MNYFYNKALKFRDPFNTYSYILIPKPTTSDTSNTSKRMAWSILRRTFHLCFHFLVQRESCSGHPSPYPTSMYTQRRWKERVYSITGIFPGLKLRSAWSTNTLDSQNTWWYYDSLVKLFSINNRLKKLSWHLIIQFPSRSTIIKNHISFDYHDS